MLVLHLVMVMGIAIEMTWVDLGVGVLDRRNVERKVFEEIC